MTCSCPTTPCVFPSCWQLGWQTPPPGPWHQKREDKFQRRQKAFGQVNLPSPTPHGPKRLKAWLALGHTLHTHSGLLDFRVSFSNLLSCLAFSLASAFCSFLAFTIWGTKKGFREGRESCRHPQAQVQEGAAQVLNTNPRGLGSSQEGAILGGAQGHKGRDRIKAHCRETSLAGDSLRNGVVHGQGWPAGAMQMIWQPFVLSRI